MKRIVIFILLSICTYNLYAQRCTVCRGKGMIGYLICSSCGGSGTTQGQNAVMQNAYEAGKQFGKINIANIVDGKSAIINGDYATALTLFKESAEAGNGEALFYYGAMYELGMGVYPDRDFAYKCYSIGSNKGNGDCLYSLNRIKKDGFWEASETVRNNFRRLLKSYFESQNNAIMNTYIQNNNSNSHNSGAHYCNSCGGTGICQSCGGNKTTTIDLIYTGGQKVVNCPVCGGSGKCTVCYGNGSFY